MRSSHVKQDNSSFVAHPGGGHMAARKNNDQGFAMSAITHGRLTFLHAPAKPDQTAGSTMGLGQRVSGALRLWRRRMRDREVLQRLTYRDMRDIGATPADIDWEMSQPFWREPRRR